MANNSLSIVALHPNAINFNVTGIIINKSNMRTFERQGQDLLAGVLKFVIRDSVDHFINVTVWGTEMFIEEYKSKFSIGHVVNVMNSKISVIPFNDTYSPMTPSPFQLTINEGFGLIEVYNGDIAEFVNLLSIPLKSPSLALNLGDIASVRSDSDSVDLVDLFVLVARMKLTRNIKNMYNVRDVIVVDQTVPGMYLTIWNEAWIDRSDTWNEMSTILHLINVSFKYSEFHKSIVLVTHSRTIIVADPVDERTASLLHYAKHSSLSLMDLDASIDLSSITTVMTIRQILDRIEEVSTDAGFYCKTYALISYMDIDGYTQFFSRRCMHCRGPIRLTEISCNKENCAILYAESPHDEHYIAYFNIPIHLTDHTGTTEKCRLIGETAERILQHTLSDFLELEDVERTAIKWSLLFERCCVKLSIKRRNALQRDTFISILDCEIADPAEVAEKIKVY